AGPGGGGGPSPGGGRGGGARAPPPPPPGRGGGGPPPYPRCCPSRLVFRLLPSCLGPGLERGSVADGACAISSGQGYGRRRLPPCPASLPPAVPRPRSPEPWPRRPPPVPCAARSHS